MHLPECAGLCHEDPVGSGAKERKAVSPMQDTPDRAHAREKSTPPPASPHPTKEDWIQPSDSPAIQTCSGKAASQGLYSGSVGMQITFFPGTGDLAT